MIHADHSSAFLSNLRSIFRRYLSTWSWRGAAVAASPRRPPCVQLGAGAEPDLLPSATVLLWQRAAELVALSQRLQELLGDRYLPDGLAARLAAFATALRDAGDVIEAADRGLLERAQTLAAVARVRGIACKTDGGHCDWLIGRVGAPYEVYCGRCGRAAVQALAQAAGSVHQLGEWGRA